MWTLIMFCNSVNINCATFLANMSDFYWKKIFDVYYHFLSCLGRGTCQHFKIITKCQLKWQCKHHSIFHIYGYKFIFQQCVHRCLLFSGLIFYIINMSKILLFQPCKDIFQFAATVDIQHGTENRQYFLRHNYTAV